jgi:YHS domain-containing protein
MCRDLSPRKSISVFFFILCASSGLRDANAGGSDAGEIPAALAPFEYLVGRWRGQGVPKDDPTRRFRGWTETHTWAWHFKKGIPAGLIVSIEGGRLFDRATLVFAEHVKIYRLEGMKSGAVRPEFRYVGTLDQSGKLLTLERADAAGHERLTLRANSNYVRYTMGLDRKNAKGTVFSPIIEVGLTQEGESFAAGSAVAERPRCIVTGGAATMTVPYQGQTYPICCTGCHDEFLENPKKYLKKLSLKSTGGEARTEPAKASRVSRFEDAFASDMVESGNKPSTKMSQSQTSEAAEPSVGAKDKEKSKAPPSNQVAVRAATWLRLGRNLEKAGKSASALKYYRQIIKECPATPSARTAAERIKALEGS